MYHIYTSYNTINLPITIIKTIKQKNPIFHILINPSKYKIYITVTFLIDESILTDWRTERKRLYVASYLAYSGFLTSWLCCCAVDISVRSASLPGRQPIDFALRFYGRCQQNHGKSTAGAYHRRKVRRQRLRLNKWKDAYTLVMRAIHDATKHTG
jgi:hypothetical protein